MNFKKFINSPGLSPTKLTSWQSHPLPSEGQHALASIRTGVSDHPAFHWIEPLATTSIVTSGRDRRRWCGARSGRDGKRGGGAGRAPWTGYVPTVAAATMDCPRIRQPRRWGWPLPVADVAAQPSAPSPDSRPRTPKHRLDNRTAPAWSRASSAVAAALGPLRPPFAYSPMTWRPQAPSRTLGARDGWRPAGFASRLGRKRDIGS